MVVLYLMRHAAAESSSGGRGDKLRPLSLHGRMEARAVGEHLRGAGIHHVLVSDAARTRQTVAELRLMVPVEVVGALYNAGSDTILALVRELADDIGVALVVGHSPGIPSLAWDLAGDTSDSAAVALIATHFPTATLCRLESDGPWSSLRSARLVETRRPLYPRVGGTGATPASPGGT